MKIFNEIADKDIKKFLSTNPRTRIVFHNSSTAINSLNIGLELSKKLSELELTNHLGMKAKDILHDLMVNNEIIDDIFGKIISIENLGILFESELKFNFNSFLEEYSKNNLLLVKWDGKIKDDGIYYLTEKNGVKISISNLNYITYRGVY